MSPPQDQEPPGATFNGTPISRRALLAATGLAAGLALVGNGILEAAPASAAVPAANGYIYPTDPFRASTEAAGQFNAPRENGRRHMGLDTWGYRGMPILAVASGRVIGGDWQSTSGDGHGWGHNVLIDHGNGVVTRSAHFNGAPTVGHGATVSQGQIIGYMGNSQYGPTSGMGVHLHFEVLINGAYISPLHFLTVGAGPSPTNPQPLIPSLEDDLATQLWLYTPTNSLLLVDHLNMTIRSLGNKATVERSAFDSMAYRTIAEPAWTQNFSKFKYITAPA